MPLEGHQSRSPWLAAGGQFSMNISPDWFYFYRSATANDIWSDSDYEWVMNWLFMIVTVSVLYAAAVEL